MFTPRGSIVRSARLRTDEDGAVLTITAPAVLVTVHANSESRRTFRRAVKAAGCIAEAVEGSAYAEADGTFNRRTGQRQRPENVQPHTFRVVGPADGLRAVCESPSVQNWSFCVNVGIPRFGDGVSRDKQTGVPQSVQPRPLNVSPRVAAAARLRSMARPERLAIEEREARRLMSAEERERIAIAEANELPH